MNALKSNADLKGAAKISRFVRIIAVLAVLVATAYVVIGNYAKSSSFQRIERGMSKADVIAMMGRPSSESACSDNPMWEDKPVLDVECVREIRYDAILLPEFWTVGFDAQDHAVTKYHYVSP